MSKNSGTSVVFTVGGAIAGAGVSATVGGMGLVGGFGGVGIGMGAVTGVGTWVGAATYGAYKGIETGDPTAIGAVGLGAIASTGVYTTVGGMGLSVGGTAFGIGIGSMAVAGGVFGLGIYGLHQIFSASNTEANFYSNLYFLEQITRDYEEKAFWTALEVEEELQQLKTQQSQQGVNSKHQSTQAEKPDFEPQIKDPGLTVMSDQAWRCVATLKGHTAPVNRLAIAPQRNIFASASDDKTVTLWNLQTQKSLYTWFGAAEVYAVAISPDGKNIIAGDFNCQMTNWQLETKAYNSTFYSESGSPRSHDGLIYALAYSPDGKIIASGSADKTIRLWHCNGRPKRTLQGHEDAVCAVAFSPDGQTLVSGSADGTVRLWQIIRREVPSILYSHQGWVTAVAISPDGKTIISGSTDSTIKIFNLSTGKLLHTLQDAAAVWSVAVHPDGTMLASANCEGRVKLWCLETGEELWWEVFAVSKNARLTEVKRAYRRLVKQYHPDLNPTVEAKASMQIIVEAYRQFCQENSDLP